MVNATHGKLLFDCEDLNNLSVTSDPAHAEGGHEYPMPPVFPNVGEHPRILFREKDIPLIREAAECEENHSMKEEYERFRSMPLDGVLGEPQGSKKGSFHNYDQTQLGSIQAKAFSYAVYGNREDGDKAIDAMMNLIATLNIVYISSDQCRQYGNVMYTAACVYDWCYDLLSKEEREIIVKGIEHRICRGRNEAGQKMEVGFPPVGQGAVSGHGSERQIPRDYLSFAIAIYDEYPLWWNMIGGRYYSEYVPVRQIYFKGWMYPQGVSNYVRTRYVSDLWAVWLLKAMGAENPYDETDMREVMRTVFCFELPGGYAFNMGDSGSATAKMRSNYGTCAMISAFLFNDETMRAQAKHLKHSFTVFENSNSFATAAECLILSSTGVKTAENRHADYPTVRYNGGWLGQTIIRKAWDDEKSPVALMKIGVRSTANHDHEDAGQFQLFYRGLLAGDSGCYAGYGSDHRKYYHKSTVAHNCVLVYNPENGENPLYKGFYSGGQIMHQETGTLEGWLDPIYDTGKVTARREEYRPGTDTPLYAYLSGDISTAYGLDTVQSYKRSMLTVFPLKTGVPAIFAVYDKIVSCDPAFKKTWLLHTVTEPEINGNRAEEINGEGKLVFFNLDGGDVSKIGGVGNNYSVNGAQVVANNNADDGFWGRIEITPKQKSAEDTFFNVMYLCDAENDPCLSAEKITLPGYDGCKIGNTVLLFSNSEEPAQTTFVLPEGKEYELFVASDREIKRFVCMGGIISL